MMCVAYLYHNFSFIIFSSGATTHLLHQLKCPLIYAKISEAEKTICIENANKIYMVKIQTLYHHLCSYQNINALLLEKFNKIVVCMLSFYCIIIHSCYPCSR